jgi:hypothetical protein
LTIAADDCGRAWQLNGLRKWGTASLRTYRGGGFIFCHASRKYLFAMGASYLSLSKNISNTGQLLTMLAAGQYRH